MVKRGCWGQVFRVVGEWGVDRGVGGWVGDLKGIWVNVNHITLF